MTRLDVRVKTELPVWINHYKLDTEKAANASELSLSGLLIDGWTNKIHDTCLIKLVIPKSNEVELVGEFRFSCTVLPS
jgi:hypothetical protein